MFSNPVMGFVSVLLTGFQRFVQCAMQINSVSGYLWLGGLVSSNFFRAFCTCEFFRLNYNHNNDWNGC
jgi:hypothetical protein